MEESFFISSKIILLIGIILTFVCYLHLDSVYDEKDRVKSSFRHLLYLSTIVAFTYFWGIVTPDAAKALTLLSIDFAIFDFCVFVYLIFAILYINNEKCKNSYIIIPGILFSIDSIGLIANIHYKHIFTISEIVIDGRSFNKYIPTVYYIPHYILSVLVVVVFMFLFAYAAIKAPNSYKHKYYSVLMSIIGAFALNLFFHKKTTGIDTTLIIIPHVIVVSYYFAIINAPKKFIKSARVQIIDNMDSGIIIIDYNGEYKDANRTAKELLGFDNDNAQEVINRWLDTNHIDISERTIREFKDYSLPNTPILEVSCNHYKEEKTPDKITATYIKIDDRTEFVAKEKEERFIASHDMLTGLFNRDAIYNEIERLLAREKDYDYYIVVSDIENFKLYNELFGTEEGDSLLKHIGETLVKNISEAKIIGRLGADRFLAVIEKRLFSEEIFKAAFKEVTKALKGTYYNINAYIGIYEATERDIPASTMCDRAIIAVQSIKGKSNVFMAFYDDKLVEDAHKENELVEEIKKAFENDEFTIFLQPQVSPEGKVLGGEALVRWNHPVRGVLTPYHFIPIMEKRGLIPDMDYVVWSKACEKLREWKNQGIEDMYISVNISPKDFYYRDVYNTFIDLQKKYMIDRSKLKLEITETAVMQNPEEQLSIIHRLRNAGFIVEMDDFGSGYSSLSMLNKINVDVLKMDMAFLEEGSDPVRSEKILKFIHNMAEGLKMETIVEGVETKEQLEILSNIGFDIYQGYYFSKPVPMDEFEEKYLHQNQ